MRVQPAQDMTFHRNHGGVGGDPAEVQSERRTAGGSLRWEEDSRCPKGGGLGGR